MSAPQPSIEGDSSIPPSSDYPPNAAGTLTNPGKKIKRESWHWVKKMKIPFQVIISLVFTRYRYSTEYDNTKTTEVYG